MVPHRLGALEAWLERCAACDVWWADKLDIRSLELVGRQQLRAQAIATLDEGERREFANELASTTGGYSSDLSPVQAALAYFGIPVLVAKEGDREPWVTWLFALVLAAVFVAGTRVPALDPTALAYHPGDGVLAATTAIFAHFGWLHLLGNLGFLVAFGDGLEQKLPRAGMAVFLLLTGAMTTLAQGLLGGHVVIGGASGAISAVMGACLVLQPRSKVYVFLFGFVPIAIRLPIFGALELLFQVGAWTLGGDAGVAWFAHLVGLVLGIAIGIAIRTSREAVPDEALERRLLSAHAPVTAVAPADRPKRSPWR